MSEYERTLWVDWLDRLIVVVALVCLGVGLYMMSTYANAQTSVPPAVQPTPRAMMTVLDPRGNEVLVFDSDGTLRFDMGGTIAWSRHFVGEGWSVPKCSPVQVLTWVNTTTGRQPLFLQGCMPVQPKDAP